MSTPQPSILRDAAALAVVLAVGAALALHGLNGRDLMGDEAAMLAGDFTSILTHSLDPRAPFTGHLPLAFWLRRCVLLLFGEDPAWAWRLSSALAYLATPLVLWGPARRLGGWGLALGLGLVLLACPVLLFHAHDGGNYALTALLGAAVLRGLAQLEEGDGAGATWLGLGLALGALTDLFLGLLAGVVLVRGGLRWARGQGRPALRRALALGAVGTVPVGLLLGARLVLSSAGSVVSAHAEGAAPTDLPVVLDVPVKVLARVCGAFLLGYPAGRNLDLWEALPAVLWTLAAGLVLGVAWARGRASSLGRASLVLVAGVLGGAVVFGVIFRLLLGRTLPYEPRHFIGLGPALGVLWVSALAVLPTWPRRLLSGVLALCLGAALLPAWMAPGDLVAQAATEVAAGWRAGDRAVGDVRFGVRL